MPRDLRYSRRRETIRSIGGAGRTSEIAIEFAKGGQLSSNNREVELQGDESLEFSGSQRRIPFIKPERNSPRDGVVQGQVSDLVPQGLIEAAKIASKYDGASRGHSDPCAPTRRATAGDAGHARRVGGENQGEGRPCAAAEARPGEWAIHRFGEADAESEVFLPRHDSDPTHRGVAQGVRGLHQQIDQAEDVRGGSPPEATRSSISLQRLPQGLNLLALKPSSQLPVAAVLSPMNQEARPSS